MACVGASLSFSHVDRGSETTPIIGTGSSTPTSLLLLHSCCRAATAECLNATSASRLVMASGTKYITLNRSKSREVPSSIVLSLAELQHPLLIQEALELQPAAFEQGSLLAQLYMMRGQPEDALEVATALRQAAPHDADAHGLFVLLKEAQGVDTGSKQEVAEAYLNLLQCDPAAYTAVQGNVPADMDIGCV